MSWDTEMPLLLRYVIGDIDPTTPKYSDDTLGTLLLTAAQFMQNRLSLPTAYAVDTENFALTPDPTDPDTRNDAFINLTILKAACMLMNSEVRIYGQQAIAIRDGTSAIDLKRDLKTLQSLANSYCQELEKSVSDYFYSNTSAPGEAIVGPYKTLVGRVERGLGRECRW